MSIYSSGKKLEGFFTGKGFYIVLFLCAAVIGVSAWMIAAGNETMENLNELNTAAFEAPRVETVIIQPEEKEAAAPVISTEKEELAPVMSDAQTQSVAVTAAPLYVWPVQGEVERLHDIENLSYDVTLRDWRTHNGIDICAPLGEQVCACRAGSIESIVQDDLYGTVLSIAHIDGSRSVYANLAQLPAVSVGDWVEPGDIIGAVGDTALCESGQGTHLHFALYVNGEIADPLDYLSA